MKETWKPVKDFEGIFEVSDQGRVKTLARYKKTSKPFPSYVRENIREGFTGPEGYKSLSVQHEGRKAEQYVHRLVAQAFLETWDESLVVDHINHVRDDNRAVNLRMCTVGENNRYQFKKKHKGYTSKYKGVHRPTGSKSWRAYARVYLGSFETEELAAAAYDAYATEHYGDFALLNATPESKDVRCV